MDRADSSETLVVIYQIRGAITSRKTVISIHPAVRTSNTDAFIKECTVFKELFSFTTQRAQLLEEHNKSTSLFTCVDRESIIWSVNQSGRQVHNLFRQLVRRADSVVAIRGLSGKYPAILNISRTGRVALQ